MSIFDSGDSRFEYTQYYGEGKLKEIEALQEEFRTKGYNQIYDDASGFHYERKK